MEDRRRRGSGVVLPCASRVLRHRGSRRDIDVVAHERDLAELEERQVRRVELELFDDHRVRPAPKNVFGHPDGCAELRDLAWRRLNRTQVDGVPLHGHSALVDVRLEDAGDVLAQVVIHQHQLSTREGQRRHDLMARRGVVWFDGERRRPDAIQTRRHDDAGVVRLCRSGGAKAPLRPCQVHSTLAVDRHCRIRVGAKGVGGGFLVKSFERSLGHHRRLGGHRAALADQELHQLTERTAAVELAQGCRALEPPAPGRTRHHDGVLTVVAKGEPSPRDVHGPGNGVDRDRGSLVDRIFGSADDDRRAPRDAAIDRAREHDGARQVEVGPSDDGVGDI